MEQFFAQSSYHFTWYTVPLVAVGALNWLLGLLTYRRERGSAPSRTLLAMTFTIGLWLLALGGATATHEDAAGAAWVKLSMFGTAFVPVCAFLHAALGSSRYRLLLASALVGAAISATLVGLALSTHLVIAETHRYYWGYYPVYGPLGPVLIAYYGLFFVAGGALYRVGHVTTKSDTHRKRMRLRLLALLLALPATVDFLPTMRVGLYPFGYVFILGYISVSTYIIWRYRLVDITPALAANQVIGTMAEGLLVVDRDGVVRIANEAAAEMCAVGRNLVNLSLQELDAKWGRGALADLMDPDVANEREVEFRTPDGSRGDALVVTSRLLDHLGAWVGTVYIIHDITERSRAERVVRESEERFRSLVQNASDLITVIQPDTTVLYQSPATRRVLGIDADAAVGQKLVGFVHRDDQPPFLNALTRLMAGDGETVTGEGRVRAANGEWRHLEFTGTDQRAHPAIGGLVLNVRDVTERRRLEEQLRYQALHDPLTGLANRTRFLDRLEHALARTARSAAPLAVMFLDLDNFKGINDSLGHPAGDRLLVEVAERLQECLRPADTIARLGGDEFAILAEDISSGEIPAVAGRIFETLQRPFPLDGRDVIVRVSIGIATNQGNAAYTADQLLRDADIAMYAAKAQGKGCHRIFESTMEVSMMERLELIADLPRALDQEELLLHYQPVVVLRTGELFGLEALVRWQHPSRGLLAPMQFIPLAEECGAIVSIGSWVLAEACRQAAEWQARYGNAPWTVSVNVSVKQLQQARFVDEVRDVLEQTGLAPSRLMLEITESVVMKDAAMMLRRLRELKALGVGLAIDDFGTGYSSLSYLREFPFDFLKIDQSFIDDVGAEAGGKDLTKAIIELGKTLELELVAEGIERHHQLARLQDLECGLGQGFYFAEPMEPAAAGRRLAALCDADAAA